MSANPILRLELACANAVERAFALAFPSALQPVQIARKLAASFEAGAAGAPRAGRRFDVRLAPADAERLAADLPHLERQWSAMLAGLADRSGRPQRRPEIAVTSDALVATGTVAIVVESVAEPESLALTIRTGFAATRALPRDGRLIVGRDPSCDFVVVDPRVSRRHLEILAEGGRLAVRDLESSNGTRLNGATIETARLAIGDVLAIGDSELAVEGTAT